MNNKTGVVACKKPDAEKEFVYVALLFVTEIPHHVTDEDFKNKLNISKYKIDATACAALVFRSDIHATSNEIQEQYEQHHPNDVLVQSVTYKEL